jgi:hypothetical protein
LTKGDAAAICCQRFPTRDWQVVTQIYEMYRRLPRKFSNSLLKHQTRIHIAVSSKNGSNRAPVLAFLFLKGLRCD